VDEALEEEHVCAMNVPVCSCGNVWEFYRDFTNRHTGEKIRTYSTKTTVDRYHALYGKPEIPFIPTAKE
jgi:hypothetical protein